MNALIFLCQDFQIRPESEMRIWGKIANKDYLPNLRLQSNEPQQMIIIEGEAAFEEKHNVKVAATMSDVWKDGLVPVLIINMLKTLVKLKKQTVVASVFEPDIAFKPKPLHNLSDSELVERKKQILSVFEASIGNEETPEVEKNRIWQIIEKYHHIFALDKDYLDVVVDLVKFDIDTGDALPIKEPQYHVSQTEEQTL